MDSKIVIRDINRLQFWTQNQNLKFFLKGNNIYINRDKQINILKYFQFKVELFFQMIYSIKIYLNVLNKTI